MKLYVMRHGPAEDHSDSGQDSDRALTVSGRDRTRSVAKTLIDGEESPLHVATSPLVRAVQTAEIVADAFDGARLVQIAALSPRKPPAQLLEWLQAHPPEATVALVGHEPHLSTFLCWLLTGLQESFVVFKKGAAAMIESNDPVTAGRAKLSWFLKPSQLRKLK